MGRKERQCTRVQTDGSVGRRGVQAGRREQLRSNHQAYSQSHRGCHLEDQTFEEETKAIKDDTEVNEIDNRPAVSYQQPRKSTVTQHRRGAASLGRGTGPGTSGTGRTTLKSPPLADKTEETAQFNEG